MTFYLGFILGHIAGVILGAYIMLNVESYWS